MNLNQKTIHFLYLVHNMTNTENVQAIKEINEAYAILLKNTADSRYLHDKLIKLRDFHCDLVDAYYIQNKTKSV